MQIDYLTHLFTTKFFDTIVFMKTGIIVHGIIADECEDFYERARGLIARAAPPQGHGLLIPKCNAIHTFFMSYPIDAIFLDRNGKIIKSVKGIRPWRLFVWGGFKACAVLETASVTN